MTFTFSLMTLSKLNVFVMSNVIMTGNCDLTYGRTQLPAFTVQADSWHLSAVIEKRANVLAT